MITKILIGLVVILGVIAVIAAFQAPTYHIVRSATVHASPASVFAQMNDLHHYQIWNPFGKADTTTVFNYEGPSAGVGSVMAWSGQGEAGAGRMTIIESQPSERVRYRLDFIKPFAGTAQAGFTLKPAGNQTEVTWTMDGEKTYITKVFCLFMNMDKMIGGEFEKGLASLKAIVEKEEKG